MHQVGHYLERNFIFSRSFPARPAAAEAKKMCVWGGGGRVPRFRADTHTESKVETQGARPDTHIETTYDTKCLC